MSTDFWKIIFFIDLIFFDIFQECFFDRAKIIVDRNENEGSEQLNLKSECSRWWLSIRALMIFGLFGIGAFTVMKAVLKAR